jgi:hypothetical protein
MHAPRWWLSTAFVVMFRISCVTLLLGDAFARQALLPLAAGQTLCVSFAHFVQARTGIILAQIDGTVLISSSGLLMTVPLIMTFVPELPVRGLVRQELQPLDAKVTGIADFERWQNRFCSRHTLHQNERAMGNMCTFLWSVSTGLFELRCFLARTFLCP